MNVVVNICPVCSERNIPEAINCRHCGAALDHPLTDPGAKTKRTNIPAELLEGIKDWSVDESSVPDQGIAVYMEGRFTPVHTSSSGEFVIGRKSGKTTEVSENLLDLSPMGGYGQGISRRHAVIRQTAQGFEIQDLDSANGTWLNDARLAPNKSYPLESGSHLRLGRMRLFVLYRSPEQES